MPRGLGVPHQTGQMQKNAASGKLAQAEGDVVQAEMMNDTRPGEAKFASAMVHPVLQVTG